MCSARIADTHGTNCQRPRMRQMMTLFQQWNLNHGRRQSQNLRQNPHQNPSMKSRWPRRTNLSPSTRSGAVGAPSASWPNVRNWSVNRSQASASATASSPRSRWSWSASIGPPVVVELRLHDQGVGRGRSCEHRSLSGSRCRRAPRRACARRRRGSWSSDRASPTRRRPRSWCSWWWGARRPAAPCGGR